jgi:hypothetical protein
MTQTMYESKPLVGFRQLGMLVKITEHLAAAKAGDRDRESRLVTRICELRASGTKFNDLTDDLRTVVAEAIEFLKSQGRKTNFGSSDPAEWISGRDGQPRRL